MLVVLFLCKPSIAYADCAAPAGVAGDLIWNETAQRPAYCNGTDWLGFWKENSDAPISVVSTMSAGQATACAIKDDSTLQCWGANGFGATGLGTTSGTQITPAQVGAMTGWSQVSVALTGFLASSACGLRGGLLYCWGNNVYAATGLGTTSGSQTTPAQVGSFTDWNFVEIGNAHGCAIRAGLLYCWGTNAGGQLGIGSTTNQSSPVRVGSATDWDTVSTGSAHSCGIRSGALYCWGMNASGVTGIGTTSGNQTTPAQVGALTDWTSVSAGENHSCGLRGAGLLYCWGSNADGATGLGTASGTQLTPAQVGTFENWNSVSVSRAHACGLRGGALYCWGSNVDGRTGLGTASGSQTTPAQVGAETNWASVSVGLLHSCGLRSNALYCWGSNDSGRTGLGTASGTTLAPALVSASWLSSGGASGECADPVGIVGDITFNSSYNVLQYCDGNGWHAAGPLVATTGSGCAGPVGVAGDMTYNVTHNKLQYCNGDKWFHVAPSL